MKIRVLTLIMAGVGLAITLVAIAVMMLGDMNFITWETIQKPYVGMMFFLFLGLVIRFFAFTGEKVVDAENQERQKQVLDTLYGRNNDNYNDN